MLTYVRPMFLRNIGMTEGNSGEGTDFMPRQARKLALALLDAADRGEPWVISN